MDSKAKTARFNQLWTRNPRSPAKLWKRFEILLKLLEKSPELNPFKLVLVFDNFNGAYQLQGQEFRVVFEGKFSQGWSWLPIGASWELNGRILSRPIQTLPEKLKQCMFKIQFLPLEDDPDSYQ